MSSIFTVVNQGPPVEVFQVNKAYNDDPSPKKVNLSVGAYRTNEGKPWVLPIVRQIKKIIAEDVTLNHEYLPMLGLDEFTEAASKFLLGNDCKSIINKQYFGVQSLSGTGALRIGAVFLKTQMNRNIVYYSNPTWENHAMLFKHSGFEKTESYRYWDNKTKSIDFQGMCQDLENAPENSVIILHACAHNPTGCDPSKDQWMALSKIIKEKKLFPFFDCAYQGFATGNLENDSWAVRYFANEGHELFCAQSFAKNFGLYNERIGNLTVITNNKEAIPILKSQFQIIVRGMYSNPPCHGARIVSTILNNSKYFEEWNSCIRIMSERITEMRKELREKLENRTKFGTWKHITDQIGMFSYTGLSADQVEILKNKYHIYMLKSGRINICGLNTNNLDYVAKAISDVI
ncbi:hypothetical protein PGB90_000088 [Kerria lacca]